MDSLRDVMHERYEIVKWSICSASGSGQIPLIHAFVNDPDLATGNDWWSFEITWMPGDVKRSDGKERTSDLNKNVQTRNKQTKQI